MHRFIRTTVSAQWLLLRGDGRLFLSEQKKVQYEFEWGFGNSEDMSIHYLMCKKLRIH